MEKSLSVLPVRKNKKLRFIQRTVESTSSNDGREELVPIPKEWFKARTRATTLQARLRAAVPFNLVSC